MEQKIKELNDYFVGKMVAKDFEVLEMNSHYVKIRIDGKYNFYLWIAGGANFLELFNGMDGNTMLLKFTWLQQHHIYEIFRERKIEEEKLEELAKVKRLKQELNPVFAR